MGGLIKWRFRLCEPGEVECERGFTTIIIEGERTGRVCFSGIKSGNVDSPSPLLSSEGTFGR